MQEQKIRSPPPVPLPSLRGLPVISSLTLALHGSYTKYCCIHSAGSRSETSRGSSTATCPLRNTKPRAQRIRTRYGLGASVRYQHSSIPLNDGSNSASPAESGRTAAAVESGRASEGGEERSCRGHAGRHSSQGTRGIAAPARAESPARYGVDSGGTSGDVDHYYTEAGRRITSNRRHESVYFDFHLFVVWGGGHDH